jgi:hypothetical protein
MRWIRHVLHVGEERNARTILAGKPEGKRPPRRPENRWEYSTEINLTEVGSRNCVFGLVIRVRAG